MIIREILKSKSVDTVTVGPNETLQLAALRIAEAQRGLALVQDGSNALLGVISVIDINRAVADHGARAAALAVRDVMNRNVVVCAPQDSVEAALDKMNTHGVRHLPVIEGGILQDLVNLQDLLKSRFEESEVTVEEMRRYIFGVGYH